MAVRKILGFWIVLDRRGAGLSLVTWVLMLFADAVVVRYVVASWFWSSNPRWPLLPFTDGGLVVFGLYQFVLCLTWFTHFQAITTDPGSMEGEDCRDPPQDLKDPRRCKLCESRWKPPRAHHCKVCEVCIFKMDHHCPWINNCVGFYNRKFFIQLLTYVYLSLTVVVLFTFPELWCRYWRLITYDGISNPTIEWISTILLTCAFLMSALLLCTLTNFIKFHVKLVLENYTTIENLEREEGARSKFDIGRRRNWEQVFGSNPWFWWLPMHTQASRPIGDGVRWRVHYTRVIDEDEEMPHE
mmetsp:Transcript_31513/g.66947  ORF Transcript_31513/g.66947 Transcript_31513/m.66947 type:complete len:299 (-) Transcript_31513:202-1098(-)